MVPRRRRAALSAVAGISAAVLVAGCSQNESGPPPQQARHELTQALRAWSGFPAGASPQPIVLAGPRVDDPASGFADAADKLAYVDRAISAPAALPSGPATAAGYRLISAGAALRVLWAEGAKTPRQGSPLAITSMGLGTGVYDTDDGQVRLPAWVLRFRHVADPAEVLAISPRSVFRSPRLVAGAPSVMGEAMLGRDGRTLTLQFVGAPAGTGPCTAGYRPELAESRSAVAVVLHEQDHGSGACSAVGYRRQVTTILPSALGRRVLVDAATRAAITVTRAG